MGLKLIIDAKASVDAASTDTCSVLRSPSHAAAPKPSLEASPCYRVTERIAVIRTNRMIPRRLVDPADDEPAEQKGAL
jgi:hypothetical protein